MLTPLEGQTFEDLGNKPDNYEKFREDVVCICYSCVRRGKRYLFSWLALPPAAAAVHLVFRDQI